MTHGAQRSEHFQVWRNATTTATTARHHHNNNNPCSFLLVRSERRITPPRLPSAVVSQAPRSPPPALAPPRRDDPPTFRFVSITFSPRSGLRGRVFRGTDGRIRPGAASRAVGNGLQLRSAGRGAFRRRSEGFREAQVMPRPRRRWRLSLFGCPRFVLACPLKLPCLVYRVIELLVCAA